MEPDYKALAKRLSTALLKVRPLGGSELFIKVGDEYFADPEYCGDAIERMKADLHELNCDLARVRKLRQMAT
jgi:hypothetical protein